ncbi:MAG: hypothetical protein AAF585_04305 [Verrucomicrobiota bacterium]
MWSLLAPNVFLKVEATQEKLTASWLNMNGEEQYAFSVDRAVLAAG